MRPSHCTVLWRTPHLIKKSAIFVGFFWLQVFNAIQNAHIFAILYTKSEQQKSSQFFFRLKAPLFPPTASILLDPTLLFKLLRECICVYHWGWMLYMCKWYKPSFLCFIYTTTWCVNVPSVFEANLGALKMFYISMMISRPKF